MAFISGSNHVYISFLQEDMATITKPEFQPKTGSYQDWKGHYIVKDSLYSCLVAVAISRTTSSNSHGIPVKKF